MLLILAFIASMFRFQSAVLNAQMQSSVANFIFNFWNVAKRNFVL
jgi:hypothetical protein